MTENDQYTGDTERNLQRKERLTVARNDEEIEVFNWVNILQPAVVRGHNPVVEKFDAEVGAGDSSMTPDAVTHWVAEELWHEFYIDEKDLEQRDIDVIDVTSEEVDVL